MPSLTAASLPMRILVFLLVPVLACSANARSPQGITLPAGFEIVEAAGPGLANDISLLHIDDQGRVVVGGRGYLRELLDTNADGIFDQTRELITGLKGVPMGVLWEGETLYLVADGGLHRYQGVTGTKAVAASKLLLRLRASGEHDAHAVKRGADGRLYLLCGNMAGVTKNLVKGNTSPITDPVAGCLLRLSLDEKNVKIVADGFRNPYDFDFNLYGEPFTFDSDNERCIGLPWSEPTRFYHIRPGAHHGWLSPQFTETWRLPPYFQDVADPVCTLGRGSPTGVVCYRHSQFPEAYQGGFFLADWTFGKVWFCPLQPKGATYTGTPTPFLEATGDNGFAPSGLAVHPKTGELFVSIGGRGTRGAVYRIRATTGHAHPPPLPFRSLPAREQVAPPLTPVEQVRALQLKLGDLCSPNAKGTVWEGYTLRKPVSPQQAEQALRQLRPLLFTTDPILYREVSRTLAALADPDPDILNTIRATLTADSHPVDDVHTLIVLARLTAKSTEAVTNTICDSLVSLDAKYAKLGIERERNWSLRLSEAASELLKKHPSLADAIVKSPKFGSPDQLWLARLPGVDRREAARRFLDFARRSNSAVWTPGLVGLLTALPAEEFLPLVPMLWNAGGVEDPLIEYLAKKPTEADRSKFLRGLRSLRSNTVAISAAALASLPNSSQPEEELLAALQSLRRVGKDKAEQKTRDALGVLLRARTGQKLEANSKAWETWLAEAQPELAKRLTAGTGFDAATWRNRLSKIDWNSGSAEAGKAVFMKATCAACHVGGNAIGPSLQGVTRRFSRDDLFTAILDPNREVPDRYRATRIVTDDGQVFDGIVIYSAVDGVILQTGADATVRIAGNRMESRRELPTSMMPSGLLDQLSDRDIANLTAYLHTLDPTSGK